MESAPLVSMATLTAPAYYRAELRPWMRRFVRVGYAAKGVIYLLIGALAFRLALGHGGRLTDSSGALRTLESLPFGTAWLTLIGAGLLAYAFWEIAEALGDTHRKGSDLRGWMSRAAVIVKALVYGAVGVQAIRLVGGMGSTSQNPDEMARRAMEFPFGGVALALAGLGIVAYGVKQVWMAWRSRVAGDLDPRELHGQGAAWVVTIGRAGVGARGVILVLIGGALARAGFDQQPSEAGGTTEALWALLTQPYGKWLLAAMALGLMCYGVFQIVHARYARL